MSRIAYVNGVYLPHADSFVHIEDRGYQLADGIYEVCEIRGGKLVDERLHLDRLERSLKELRIAMPVGRKALGIILREVVRRNRVRSGLVYMQVTRGVARRDHAFPTMPVAPSLVVTAKSLNMAKIENNASKGVAVISLPEDRWGRVDIKTIGLTSNVLAKQAAREAGAFEAWYVDSGGKVTEGASSNAWIITKDGILVTRQADRGILKGITRTVVMELIKRKKLKVEERAFTIEEAQNAKEAFLTSASAVVMPIVSVDGRTVGNGAPGHITLELRQLFHDIAEQT